MREYDVGIVPVVGDARSRNLIGLITDRDIAVRHVADSHMEDCTVGAHMTRDNIETVRENDDSAMVLEAMKRREVRRIPVINERGVLRRFPSRRSAALVTGVRDVINELRVTLL